MRDKHILSSPKPFRVNLNIINIKATSKNVIPAPAFAGVNLSPRRRGAGIHKLLTLLDSRLRGSDKLGIIRGSNKSLNQRV